MSEEKKPFEIQTWVPREDDPVYVRFSHNCTVQTFMDELEKHLMSVMFKEEPLLYQLDYTAYNRDICDYVKMKTTPVPLYHHIYCYPKWGGSEGAYFHVELFTKEFQRLQLCMAKTLTTDMETVLTINSEINRFLLTVA